MLASLFLIHFIKKNKRNLKILNKKW